MSFEFEPVTRRTVAEQVRAQLVSSIMSGELAPGTALPAERSLSEQFGVARTSVREALQGLMALGLVERRANRMCVPELLPAVAFSTPEQTDADTRKAFVAQLLETRRVLEPPIFELACYRATPAQREEIRRMSAEFWTGMPLEEFRRLDLSFHTLITSACANELLMELYGKVVNALSRSSECEAILFDDANGAHVEELIAQAVIDHQLIGRAFVDNDPGAASNASDLHVRNVERRIDGVCGLFTAPGRGSTPHERQ